MIGIPPIPCFQRNSSCSVPKLIDQMAASSPTANTQCRQWQNQQDNEAKHRKWHWHAYKSSSIIAICFPKEQGLGKGRKDQFGDNMNEHEENIIFINEARTAVCSDHVRFCRRQIYRQFSAEPSCGDLEKNKKNEKI